MQSQCPRCGRLHEVDEDAADDIGTPPCCDPNGTNGLLSTVSGSLAAEADLPSTSNDETAEQPQADESIPAGNAATPIPWEERRGFLDLGAYWQTTQGILFHPARSFAQWNPPGDMEGALLFLVVFGSMGHILAHYWLMFLQNDMAAAVGMPGDWLGFGLFALKAPFLVLLSSLVSAAIIHFFMFLLRATSHSWSKTFAFYAYLGGALSCLQLLPVAGIFITPVWGLVSSICGLRELHHTNTWRVIGAFALPLGILLVLLFFLALFIVGAGLVALNTLLES